MRSHKPFKVLHVAPSLGLGGTEKTMQLFALHLDRAWFRSVVWSPSDGPRGAMLRESGIQVVVGHGLADTAQRFQPDIVHVHRAGWPQPELLLPLRACFRPGPPQPASSFPLGAANFLSGDENARSDAPSGLNAPDRNPTLIRFPRIVETNVFGRQDPSPSGRLIDATLFVSEFCAHRLRTVEGLAVDPPRYRVLYNPVDTDRLRELSGKSSGGRQNSPVFGRISRPDPGKWSSLCLEALPLVREEIPDFRFDVVGGIPMAEEFVARHGLERNVRFLPPVWDERELAEFLGRLAFLAHANDTGESFGLVIAEAMAVGLPVLTHPSAGWRDNAQLELVQDGITGLVAATPAEYAQAIVRLLRDPELRRRMGEAGMARARALFRVQDVVRRLEAVYFDLLGG